MKKFMKKAAKVLCLVLVMAIVMSPIALADLTFGGVKVDTDNPLADPLNEAGATVTGVIKILGYIIAVVMVMWLGIQYIIATPAKKAELKGKLWSMAIGVLLLVGGVTILDVIATGFKSVSDGLQ
ncbi:MAG: hypothetical protein J6M02_00845 [Clostridia bacterium]|nr:hypothetical protein [Clostridia bacterium]